MLLQAEMMGATLNTTPLILNTAHAKAAIGKTVYWDDDSVRYRFLRSGVLQEVGKGGKNILIDGDWKWRPYLKNLRTTETV